MLYGLRNKRGETLIETLVSLAIAAISMLMFASMLAHTSRTAKTGQEWNNVINDFNQFLEEKPSDWSPDPEKVTDEKKRVEHGAISIKNGDGNKLIEGEVTFYVAEYGGEYVIAYD